MNRPAYETETDLGNESTVAEYLCRAWNCEVIKLSPINYKIDWFFHRNGSGVGWAELKCRKVGKDKYPSLILSASKITAGRQLAEKTGLPFVVVVRWNDGVFYYTDNGEKFPITVSGRKDRNDQYDIEPCVNIHTSRFIKIEGGSHA